MSKANPRFHRTNPFLPSALPNIVQLSIFYSLENQICLNNLYYFDGGLTASITLLSAFLSSWRTAYESSLQAVISNDTTIVQYKALYLNVPAIIPQYLIDPAGTVGTGGAGHLPTYTAVCITKNSNIKGQSGRGRFYTVGVPLGAVSQSTLTGGTFQTSLTTWVTKLIATLAVGANSYIPGIFSRRGYNKVTGTGGGFSGLTAGIVRQVVATVRRRKLGRGK